MAIEPVPGRLVSPGGESGTCVPVSFRESAGAASFGDASGAPGTFVLTPPQAARRANDERKRRFKVALYVEFMSGEWRDRAVLMNERALFAAGSILALVKRKSQLDPFSTYDDSYRGEAAP
jgi:hypothetical protein